MLPRFWLFWLKAACWGTLLFGALLVFAPKQGQLIFYAMLATHPMEPDQFPADALDYITFVCGVLGAVMVGWMVALLGWIANLEGKGTPAMWITCSITLWFFLDTGFSLWSGFWQNAVLNTCFGVIFFLPLVLWNLNRPFNTLEG